MKIINFILSVFAIFFVSCTEVYEKDAVEELQSNPFQFTNDVLTRATDRNFEEGDLIGIYVVKRNVDAIGLLLPSGNFADNKKYIYRNGSFEPVGQADLIYPPVGQKVDIYAYYPYRSNINPTGMLMNSNIDQSVGSGYKDSDFMWAKSERGYINSSAPIPFIFEHVMGRVKIVVLKNGVDQIVGAKIMSASVEQIGNLQSGKSLTSSTKKTVTMLARDETTMRFSFLALIPGGGSFKNGDEIFQFALSTGVTKKFVANEDFVVQAGKNTLFELKFPAEVITWEYNLNVNPTFLAFESKGEIKNLTITSTRTKFVNGVSTGISEDVTYSGSITGPNASAFSISGAVVVAQENPTTDFRDATLTIIQTNGKSTTIPLEQSGKIDIGTEI